MSRVLVVGWELAEFAFDARMEAANYRTRQLVEPLKRDGHQVHLVAGRIGTDFPASETRTVTERDLTYTPMKFSEPSWMRKLQGIHDQFQPDCVVGVTFLAAMRAMRIRTKAPLWVDIYGDPLAEMQAKAHRVKSDRGIATQLQFLQQVLRRGDVFSACSRAQRHALLGQLALVGRLNRATFGYELVHVLPAGAHEPFQVGDGPGVLRDKVVPGDSHVVLWCGGYNTWTDVDTLYRGLELAVGQDPKLHFVSLGEAVASSDSYARFREMVAESPHASRFHLLGWQPFSEVPLYYRESDIGITLDAACYEAELGTRTRLVEMMQHGLPVVTTLACELSYAMRDQSLGLTFAIGDCQALGEHILALVRDEDRRRRLAEQAREYVTNQLSLAASTAPLRDWVGHPQPAPDHVAERRSQVYSLPHMVRANVRQTLWSLAGLDQ